MFSASRKGSYVAQAGQANPLLDAFSVASAYSFNPFDLAKSGMKADTAKYIAEKENQAKRDYYKTMGETSIEGMNTLQKASDYAASQQRMAGGLGLLGALSYGTSRYFQDQKNKPPAPEPRQSADNSEYISKLQGQIELLKSQAEEDESLTESYTAPKPKPSANTSTTGGVTPTTTNTTLTPTNTTPTSYKFTDFDDLDNKAFGIISKYEGGADKFEAVNQGGTDGGYSIPEGFYSGAFGGMKPHKGKKLTNLSLDEIMELQRDPGKSAMSDSQWVNSGKLHAVGAYQFIGSTLKDEVTKMGLDTSLKFTPQLQAQIAKSHAKRLGKITSGTWRGLVNMTPQERAIIDQWNARLQ